MGISQKDKVKVVVHLGGDERRVVIAVPGSPPIALRYWMDGTRVLCEDVVKEWTGEVLPGDRKTLGKVAITLSSAAQARRTGCTPATVQRGVLPPGGRRPGRAAWWPS